MRKFLIGALLAALLALPVGAAERSWHHMPQHARGHAVTPRLDWESFRAQVSGTTIVAGSTPVIGTCTSGFNLYNNNGVVGCQASSGSGTVTGATFTGGLISVTGSTTLAFTVAGTSGGIPYFTSTSAWASSAALAANALVVGGGAGVAPSTVTTGLNVLTALGAAINASTGLPNVDGAITTGHCLEWGPGIEDAGSACGGGSSTLTVGTTPTSGGAAGQLMFDTGSVLNESANLVFSGGLLDIGASGTLGGVKLGNASTGTVTLEPVTGALGSVIASLPANTGTIAELNLAQTFTASQTIGTGNQFILPAGSASAPALVSSTDQTGIYLTANVIHFTSAGSQTANLGTSGLAVVGNVTISSGGATLTGSGGVLNVVGGYSANSIPGVSCAAGAISLVTEVVTDGIVTHC